MKNKVYYLKLEYGIATRNLSTEDGGGLLAYYTDFPFLNSLAFYFYAIGKIFDIYLYIRFRSNDTTGIISDNQVLAFAYCSNCCCVKYGVIILHSN